MTIERTLAGMSQAQVNLLATVLGLGEAQIVGRPSGGTVGALTATQIKTILGLSTGAVPTLVNSAGGALATVPADVNVGALALLTEAITAIGTLQTAVNALLHLNNQVFTILRANGLAQ